MDERVAVVAELYRALRARDWDAMAKLFTEDAELGLGGRNPLAGSHRGPQAVVGAWRRLAEEADIGPVREDTWDICTSEHHVVLIEWLQATLGSRTARFYLHLVCAFEDGRIKRAFADFVDPYGFDELWAE